MPSMKCYECKKIASCKAVAERDEHDKTVLAYYCAGCRRALEALKKIAIDTTSTPVII